MDRIAFIDGNNLCYRAYYTTGGFSHDEQVTGVAYGFLNQIFNFVAHTGPVELVFCWDSKESLRKNIYPEYKARRHVETPEAVEKRMELYEQIDFIKDSLLPALGWVGRCYQREGYEADDLMAEGVRRTSFKSIIVSTDEDLYQCLSDRCSVYRPGKNEGFFTLDNFINLYGIGPEYWVDVKAIAGCSSDNVPGVKGIGEKSAIDFLVGKYKFNNKKRMAIEAAGPLITRNYQLVLLPFGSDWISWQFSVEKIKLIRQDFYNVFKKYGMTTFIRRLDKLSIDFEMS